MVMFQTNVNFKISTKMVRSNEYFAPMTSFMTFISVKFDIGTKNAFEGQVSYLYKMNLIFDQSGAYNR